MRGIMSVIDVDLGGGDVALIIKEDGGVLVLLPPSDGEPTEDELMSPQAGLITACAFLITEAEHSAECKGMLDRLAAMMYERGADA